MCEKLSFARSVLYVRWRTYGGNVSEFNPECGATTAAGANMTAVSSPLYSKLNFTSGCYGANGALLV